MTIPKHILLKIKKIEQLGLALQDYEKELYDWIESKGINPEYDEPEGDLSLDNCLDFLFHSHNGNDLIKYLELYQKEGKKQ